MKACELCSSTARTYCESDEASLCFDCDSRVHAANFLVARHSRVLLCRSCQSHTPWKAAGPRLGPAVSVCDTCVAGRSRKKEEEDDEGESKERERTEEEEEEEEEEEDDDVSDDDGDEEESEEEEEEEEEGEEQVVPWTIEEEMAATAPPVASSSSSEEESTMTTTASRIRNGLLKRMRANVDLPSSSFHEKQLPCSSSSLPNRTGLLNPVRSTSAADDDEATSESFRPAKGRKSSVFSGSRLLAHNLMSFGSSHPPI